jgi:hypothetical protein
MDPGAAVIGFAAFLSMFVLVCVCRLRPTVHPPVPEPVTVQVREDPGDPEPFPPR